MFMKFFKNKKKTCNFGEHFTLDGYGGNFKKLNDKKLVLRCLEELPKKIGMRVLGKPQVYNAPDNGIKDSGGWSGFTVVMESHVSVHTFPHRGFVSIDVYTCRNGLDRKFISDYFVKKFKLQRLETHFIKRGTKYPVEICC
ncbi:MAG: S-adenosylmethionine decarboxylase [Candidatus Moranbacteria bacterium]|nr:S-adenosylmethionine decarboxylase [Candidatus Moranbacteria bacterium]